MEEKKGLNTFIIAYGEIVCQLLKDNGNDTNKVNEQLEEFGISMGKRLIDEFFASNKIYEPCASFEAACVSLAEKALPYYLGGERWSPAFSKIAPEDYANEKNKIEEPHDKNCCVLTLKSRCTLERYLAKPPELEALNYNNLIPGAVKGAFEILDFKVDASISTLFVKEVGENHTQLKIVLLKKIPLEIHQYDKEELR